MKSLPEKFPIRYAILVSEDFRKKELKDDFDFSERNILWCQLIDYLKKNPLNLNDLSIDYVTAEYKTDNGNKVCILPKLKGKDDRNWQEKIYQILYENIPLSIYQPSHGRAFNLTLYSYEGMMNIPIFWKVAYGNNQEQIMKELKWKELMGIPSLSGWDFSMDINFKRIMAGEMSMWEHHNFLKEPLIFYLKIPYSKVWKMLDKSINDGVVCFNGDNSLLEKAIKKDSEEEDEKEFINVVVAKDLLPLMTEEMITVYKASNFCNGCGKPLPFKYKGTYCPSIPENIECNRKRARIRKKR